MFLASKLSTSTFMSKCGHFFWISFYSHILMLKDIFHNCSPCWHWISCIQFYFILFPILFFFISHPKNCLNPSFTLITSDSVSSVFLPKFKMSSTWYGVKLVGYFRLNRDLLSRMGNLLSKLMLKIKSNYLIRSKTAIV